VETYSSLWGWRAATLAWWAAMLLAALTSVPVVGAIGASAVLAVAFGAVLTVAAMAGWRFLDRPTATRAALFEPVSGLWTLVAYLGLGRPGALALLKPESGARMPYVLHPGEPGTLDRLGGKGRGPRRPSPQWHQNPGLVRPDPGRPRCQLRPPEHRSAAAASRDRTEDVALRAEPLREVSDALATLCPNGEPVAVRSSAAGEDGPHRSFAGQFESFLFVPPARGARGRGGGMALRLRRAPPGVRRTHGLPTGGKPPAVLIQRMINASRSGVAFGADPIPADAAWQWWPPLRPRHLAGVRASRPPHVSGGSRRPNPGTRRRRETIRPPRGHRVHRRRAAC